MQLPEPDSILDAELDLLAAPDAAFQAAAQRILTQNLELYRRLA